MSQTVSPFDFKQALQHEVHAKGRLFHVDIHPTNPWILISMNGDDGQVIICNYNTNEEIKQYNIVNVNCAKFIARKNWFAACSEDDRNIHIYSYISDKIIKIIKNASKDVGDIQSLCIHPTMPYILSGCYGELKLWNWDNNFENEMTYDDNPYALSLILHPKQPNVVGAAGDEVITFWNIKNKKAIFELKGHTGGITCLDFDDSGEFIVSGSVDKTVRVWNYERKECIATLNEHSDDVTGVSFCHYNNSLYIFSISINETIRIWDTNNNFQCIEMIQPSSNMGSCIAHNVDCGHIIFGFGGEFVVLKYKNNSKIENSKIESNNNNAKSDEKEDSKMNESKIESNKKNEEFTNCIKIVNKEECIKNVEILREKLSIKDESSILTNDEMKNEYSFKDDKCNSYFMPLSLKNNKMDETSDEKEESKMDDGSTNAEPLISIKLDVPFNEWNNDKKYEFLSDLAVSLNIETYKLLPICCKNGSVELSIRICNVIDNQFPNIEKCFANSLQSKETSKFGQKWKVKGANIKEHFSGKKEKQNNEKNNNNNNNNTHVKNETLPKTTKTKTLSQEEKWFESQAKILNNLLTNALQYGSEEYEILSIMVLDNEKCLNNFIKNENYQNSKLLFHGTKLETLDSIYNGGFDDKYIGTANDSGYYGKGHYFSSYPQYCMYYCEKNPFKQQTLLACYVNCGNTFNIYENYKYLGKEIENEYQSHFVNVTKGGAAISKNEIINKTKGIDMFDEYVIKSGKYILPRYCITFIEKPKLIIWRDPKIYNNENNEILLKIRSLGHRIYAAKSSEDALNVIKVKKYGKNNIFIITNGANKSEEFIENIRNECQCNDQILVFTGSLQYSKNYSKFKNVNITMDPKDVFEFVETNMRDHNPARRITYESIVNAFSGLKNKPIADGSQKMQATLTDKMSSIKDSSKKYLNKLGKLGNFF